MRVSTDESEKKKAAYKKAYELQERQLKNAQKKGKTSKNEKLNAAKKRERESGGAKKNKGGKKQTVEASAPSGSRALTRMKEYSVNFTFPNPTELFPPIIQVKDVEFNYPEGPMLFKGLNFGIDMDSRVTIVGDNGTGKTTLLRLITQQLQPVDGEVLINRNLRVAQYQQHFLDELPMNQSAVEYLRSAYGVSEQVARNQLGRFWTRRRFAYHPDGQVEWGSEGKGGVRVYRVPGTPHLGAGRALE